MVAELKDFAEEVIWTSEMVRMVMDRKTIPDLLHCICELMKYHIADYDIGIHYVQLWHKPTRVYH